MALTDPWSADTSRQAPRDWAFRALNANQRPRGAGRLPAVTVSLKGPLSADGHWGMIG